MAEERQKQVLERVWVDAGVRVGRENPLGEIVAKVEPIEVRGGVKSPLIGERSKKKAEGWKVVGEEK